MTSNNQVSPVIRISRGERDASARATHLEAANGKSLLTTNERKQMSTTTNFKRIALVAVAALGLGVLSSVPSQAAVSGLTLTVTDGTAGQVGSRTDSSTASRLTLSGIIGDADSIVVSFVQRGIPSTATIDMHLINLDSSTPTISNILVDTATAAGASAATAGDSVLTVLETSTTDSVRIANAASQADKFISYTIGAYLDSALSTARPAGTYNFTWTVKTFEKGNALQPTTTQTRDFTITVSATTAESTTVSAVTSTAIMGEGAYTSGTIDSSVSAVATSSASPAASIVVTLKNASGQSPALLGESVTATTSVGQIGVSGGAFGRSVVVAYTGATTFQVRPDGTAGSAVITISTPSVTFAPKTVNFYSSKPATLVASVPTAALKVGSNSDAVRVVAKDANGLNWSGALYIYASTAADGLIASSATVPTLCTWDAADGRHECAVDGLSSGTAKLKVFNYATAAASAAADLAVPGSTVTSNEVSVRVSTALPASVKISFDKATYAPNERARIYVTPLDSTGAVLGANAITDLLASGGITTNSSITFSAPTTADSLTATTITPIANASSTTGATAGSMVYTVFMPSAGGAVTITATGGTALPEAARVAVTATATVTDSGAAALAAVTALATTVASLRTLIVTLTNLVLKIQKKVRA